ncbi:hypothetical protein F8388_017381 [Cannabis sativa]|uniref:Uncharacterized protein n=1 Tax=Cannabis sativa TaxID=3483 RepID=A0A7J6H930_CANSA|nr:hypothetical protein F8388_017381 [Cannabis sativa]
MTSPNSNVNSSSAANTHRDKSSKQPWRPTFATSSCSAEDKTILGKLSLCQTSRSTELSSKNIGPIPSFRRILFSDLSRSSSTRGFGTVHKGYVDENLRQGLKPQPVAVKLLDIEGLQGHREWLVTANNECSFQLNLRKIFLVQLNECVFRFCFLTHVDLLFGSLISTLNSDILLNHKMFSVQIGSHFSADAQAFQAHLLPPEVIDRGLQELANGCPNLRKVALVGANELGLLSLAEECLTLQDLELHKCNNNVLRGTEVGKQCERVL